MEEEDGGYGPARRGRRHRRQQAGATPYARPAARPAPRPDAEEPLQELPAIEPSRSLFGRAYQLGASLITKVGELGCLCRV